MKNSRGWDPPRHCWIQKYALEQEVSILAAGPAGGPPAAPQHRGQPAGGTVAPGAARFHCTAKAGQRRASGACQRVGSCGCHMGKASRAGKRRGPRRHLWALLRDSDGSCWGRDPHLFLLAWPRGLGGAGASPSWDVALAASEIAGMGHRGWKKQDGGKDGRIISFSVILFWCP